MPIMRLRNWSRKNQVTYGKDGNPWRTLRSSLASADGRQPSLCERGAPVPSGLRSRFNSGVGSGPAVTPQREPLRRLKSHGKPGSQIASVTRDGSPSSRETPSTTQNELADRQGFVLPVAAWGKDCQRWRGCRLLARNSGGGFNPARRI